MEDLQMFQLEFLFFPKMASSCPALKPKTRHQSIVSVCKMADKGDDDCTLTVQAIANDTDIGGWQT